MEDPKLLANALAHEKKVVRHFMEKREFPFIAQDHESVIATVCNVEEALLMILHGPFIGFLPRHFARPWLEDGQLVALMPERFMRYSQVFLVHHKMGLAAKSAARSLLERTKKERRNTQELSVGA